MNASRPLHLVLAALPLFACLESAGAATMRFISLNALHYGWAAGPLKNPRILAEFQRAPTFNGILLQEVMSGADFSPIAPYPSYIFCESNLLGYGTYKEKYVVMVSTVGFAAFQACNTYPDPTGGFSRPPAGMMITTSHGGKDLWLIDYHAVFGKSVTARKAEIAQMPAVATWFHGALPAIVAGDWNLRGDAAPMNAWIVSPVTNFTSLKQNGGWSQAYDHFALFNGPASGITFNGCTVVVPLNGLPDWRQNVSDHVPVYCEFNY